MRTRILLIVGVLGALAVVGCGIPKEEHQATLDQLAKVTAEAAAAAKACDQDKAKLKTSLDECGQENMAMRNKLTSLGEDLSKLQTKAGSYLKDISEKEKQIAQLQKAQEAARKREQTFRDLLAQFKKMIDSGAIQVVMRNGRMIVKLSDKILFDPGKTKLKDEGELALAEVAKILGGIKGRSFQVAGHTDNVPIRSRRFKSNWELSTARAVNVVQFLIESGMDPKYLSAAGYSEYDPVQDNATPEGRAANRRIEITLMPNLEELAGAGF